MIFTHFSLLLHLNILVDEKIQAELAIKVLLNQDLFNAKHNILQLSNSNKYEQNCLIYLGEKKPHKGLGIIEDTQSRYLLKINKLITIPSLIMKNIYQVQDTH